MTAPIICFDLDGTLLDEHQRIHPTDVEILQNTRDVLFIPCTGRPMHAVTLMFHENGMFQNTPIPFPVVTQNGSAVYTPGEVTHAFHRFSKDIQSRLLDYFDRFPELSIMLMEEKRTVLMHPTDVGAYWMRRFNTHWEPYDDDCRSHAIGKATCITDSRELHVELKDYLQHLPLEIGVSMSTIFDINPRGVSKRSGVLSMMEYLGLSDMPVYAAGDGENDLDLFSLARKTFSPATSPVYIQQQSDYVVDVAQNGILTKMLEVAGVIKK